MVLLPNVTTFNFSEGTAFKAHVIGRPKSVHVFYESSPEGSTIVSYEGGKKLRIEKGSGFKGESKPCMKNEAPKYFKCQVGALTRRVFDDGLLGLFNDH